MKTIGYVTQYNPFSDKVAWSGTIFKIRESIERAGYHVQWIPIRQPGIVVFIEKALTKITNSIFRGKWSQTRVHFALLSKMIDWNQINQCDYLFFPTNAQVINFSNISTPPIIYLSDTNFHQMVGYYWKLPKWNIRQGDAMEKGAIDKSAVVIRSSQWAADSAIIDYGCPEEKVEVLEFGANIDEKDIFKTTAYQNGSVLNILFSGVDWVRKGAEIAIDTVRLLNEAGIKSKLFLVGITFENIPEQYKCLDFVEYVGFLNKNYPEQYDRYVQIVKRCHCLLLPTVAECAGIVFSESTAYGLPIFTSDTGGIANYVVNGINGYRLPLCSTAGDYAKTIVECISDHRFQGFHDGSLELYEEKLSWKVWSCRFAKIMNRHFGENVNGVN